ncbi:MAG: hypothetical protein J5825_09425 [Lachnospiraceae bacterium]|nr:hypothetical protein [Lachnospiraceae bacterium]
MQLRKLFTALILFLLICCVSAVPVSAQTENPYNKQDNTEVPYDSSKWVQPAEWNTPQINPRDFEGYVMIFADKIGLEPDYAPGTTQRVYVSYVGETVPVNQMKFHFFYDTRLKVKCNSKNEPVSPGSKMVEFTMTSKIIEEGQIAIAAYSPENVDLGEKRGLFTIDFIIPEDAKPGDLYPYGMMYVDDGIVADTFINTPRDTQGMLQMTYTFTRGMYSGWIKIHGGEPKNTSTPTPKPTETPTPTPKPTETPTPTLRPTAPPTPVPKPTTPPTPTPKPTNPPTPVPKPTEPPTPVPKPTEPPTPVPKPVETSTPTPDPTEDESAMETETDQTEDETATETETDQTEDETATESETDQTEEDTATAGTEEGATDRTEDRTFESTVETGTTSGSTLETGEAEQMSSEEEHTKIADPGKEGINGLQEIVGLAQPEKHSKLIWTVLIVLSVSVFFVLAVIIFAIIFFALKNRKKKQ